MGSQRDQDFKVSVQGYIAATLRALWQVALLASFEADALRRLWRSAGGLDGPPGGAGAFHPCAAFRWIAAARRCVSSVRGFQVACSRAWVFAGACPRAVVCSGSSFVLFFFGAWVCARLGLQKAPDRGWGPGSRSCPELPGQTGRHPFPMIRRMRGRLG